MFLQVVSFCGRNGLEIRNSKILECFWRPQSQWFQRFKENLPGCKQEILEATPSTCAHIVDGQNPLVDIVEIQNKYPMNCSAILFAFARMFSITAVQ